MRRLAAAALGLLLAPGAALAADVDRSQFRYERLLPPAIASGRMAFEPDGLLLAHAKPELVDLRIVDARGHRVPWRRVPAAKLDPLPATVLNSGRRAGAAVALVDLGPGRRVYDRVELDIQGNEFVGRVTVSGADRRRGPFTRLSTTRIYDVSGATSARSTTALVPPTDFRYLQLRAEGVERIDGAYVSAPLERPRLVRRRHAVLAGRRHGVDATVYTLDFGLPRIPVSRLEVRAATPRYDRPVRVEGSNDRRAFALGATGRTSRSAGELSPPLALESRYRYLRVVIANGDDAPLRGIRIETFGPSRAIMVEGGHPEPLRLLYGGPAVGAPSYEFARLPARRPAAVLDPSQLPPERLNAAFEPPADTRSFLERHDWVAQAAIALAALAVGAAGLLALRRRT
ncbi:MAG: hypothetical protein ABR583_13030 [Gaiellaceae bacterium]